MTTSEKVNHSVKSPVNSPGGHDLDRVFHSLSDGTRRAIIEALATGERSVSELAAPFDMSLPAVSKHVRVLEGAGLLERQKRGRVNWCRLRTEPLRSAVRAIAYYDRFWGKALDSLDEFLEEEKK